MRHFEATPTISYALSPSPTSWKVSKSSPCAEVGTFTILTAIGSSETVPFAGLYVPAAHLSFLSSVSERLATAVPTHSLGVLVQFCAAVSVASPAEGAAYIHCLRPWLHNLHSLAHIPRGESDAVQTKLRRCLRQLLNVAVREPAVLFFPPATSFASPANGHASAAPRRAGNARLARRRQNRLPHPYPH